MLKFFAQVSATVLACGKTTVPTEMKLLTWEVSFLTDCWAQGYVKSLYSQIFWRTPLRKTEFVPYIFNGIITASQLSDEQQNTGYTKLVQKSYSKTETIYKSVHITGKFANMDSRELHEDDFRTIITHF
jgi:hypothetical protein